MQTAVRSSRWLALVPAVVVASSTGAETFTVAQDDSGDYATIQDAIDGASDGDTITIYAGTYTETIDPSGLAITVQANLDDYGDVIIDGEDTRQCLICADEETEETVFVGLIFENGASSKGGALVMEGASAIFSFCTFRNSNATGDGGALWMDGGSPTFDTCTFDNCSAGDDGGAATLNDSNASFVGCTFSECSAEDDGGAFEIGGGSPSFENCLFSSNVASWTCGAVCSQLASPSFVGCTFTGCMSVGFNVGVMGLYSGTDTVEITDCIFFENQAGETGEEDVGVLKISETVVDLDGCAFDGNIAASTGAIWISGESSVVTVTDSQFDNHVGGAIVIQTGELAVSSSGFSGNSNDGTGGGAVRVKGHSLYAPPVASFADSTFANNSARWGGAIYVLGVHGFPATLDIDGCTITDGSVTSKGAGVYSSNSETTMTNCELSGNTVSGKTSLQGGGVYASNGTFDISYTTFSGNSCSSNYGHAVMISSGCDMTLTSVSSCDHAIDGEIYGDYIDGGDNDLGGWCCPGDVDQDGDVESDDLLSLLEGFGSSSLGADDREDCSRDGDVDVEDLLGLLEQWGDCSE